MNPFPKKQEIKMVIEIIVTNSIFNTYLLFFILPEDFWPQSHRTGFGFVSVHQPDQAKQRYFQLKHELNRSFS